jgi:glutaredoxin-like YruB-family protein
MKKLLVLVVIALLLYLAWSRFQGTSGPAPGVSADGAKVVIYSTDWCGYCRKAKAFFREQGIAYVDYDIEKDAEARREFERLEGRGVPLIVIGNEVIRGYDEQAILPALGR